MLVAHQGGWDEAAFTVVPIAVFGLLLWLAKRRAERADGGEPDAADDDVEEIG